MLLECHRPIVYNLSEKSFTLHTLFHVNWFKPGVFNPRPAGRMRPSGEFCAAREGYFTKYNAL